MRVISGKYKRTTLKGFDTLGVRPTMDKVKESIFAMISMYLEDSICLDLFAGTGSLGIEALSNGSKYVYFVDHSKDAIKIIKNNIEKVGCMALSNVIYSDYLSSLKTFSNNNIKFDIVFIDPPYGKIKIKDIINKLLELNVLKTNSILICEYENEELDEKYNSLKLIKYRKYGKTYISIYKNMG